MIVVPATPHPVGCVIWQRSPPRWATTVVVKGTYTLTEGAPAALAATQRPLSGDVHEPGVGGDELVYASDFAPEKPRVDFVVRATCRADPARPEVERRVRLALGPLQVALRVVGDRRTEAGFTGWKVDPPQPLVDTPLGYARAYGGPGYAANPVGRGHLPPDALAGLLPNLEAPATPVHAPNAAVAPVALGPIPLTWPQRMRHAGTYGPDWLERRFPWFPEDFDAAFHQVAPAERQLDRLRGDEEILVEGLLGPGVQQRFVLPAVRMRAFGAAFVGAPLPLVEVPLRLDLVHLDLDAGELVLLWRGVRDAPSEAVARETQLLVVEEALAAPPTPLREVESRLLAALAPEAPPAPDPADALPPPPDPTPPGPTPPDLAALATLIAAGGPLSEVDLADAVLDGIDLRGRDLRGALLSRASLRGALLDGAQLDGAQLEDADLTRAQLSGASLVGADLTGARLQGAALAGARLAKADASYAILADADLTGTDAPGAAFRRADLQRARLGGAALEGADFTRAQLSHADFSDAHLGGATLELARAWPWAAPRADLTGVRAAGAHLVHADLRGAQAPGSTWQDARLDEADLTDTNLDRAELEGASLVDATLTRTRLRRARLVRIRAQGAKFERCDLLEASLSGAQLADAVFTECSLYAVDLWETVAGRRTFHACDLGGTLLELRGPG